MKVALISTWNERCGIAEYGKNLVLSILGLPGGGDCFFRVFDRPYFGNLDKLISDMLAYGADIAHLNYEPGLFGNFGPFPVKARTVGIKTVLTLHTSHAGDNRTPFTELFDRVVVHEKTEDPYVHIPMGVTKGITSSHFFESRIGTVGFPFPWKGFHQVALAAEKLGKQALVIAPESPHFPTEAMEKVVTQANPSCIYMKNWMEQEEVIHRLSECLVNVFAYAGNNAGISAAVRFGLAAGRPLICSRSRQFRDLFAYENEIEFVQNPLDPDEIAVAIHRIQLNHKVPEQVVQDMNWVTCASRYHNVYQGVLV